MSGWTLSVSQLNEYVRKQLAGDPILRRVQVRGEISGFKRHFSGHLYFSLKDEGARVQCVMFRQHALALGFEPRDGQRVTVNGAASLYAQTGGFQLYCEGMQREGAGEMYLKFEALKERLAAEGLFDPARKKPLPLLPGRVGLVTSRSGAALRDMLRIIGRRAPGVQVLLCPAAVQGEGAAAEIARALDRLNEDGTSDVVLCGRGGGSAEDLWAFNEEIVARAIARSRIPVISCVGHEVDFTISDFVSDVRAATPSMAAELAVPVTEELKCQVMALAGRLERALLGRTRLSRARVRLLSAALGRPDRLIEEKRVALKQIAGRMERAQRAAQAAKRARLTELERSLAALNPEAVLERGYALILSDRGLVTRAQALSAGDKVRMRLRDGEARATIDEVKGEGAHGGQEKDNL